MSKMSVEEQVRFLEDGQLIMSLKGGDPYAINGYTVEQVRKEAEAARKFIAKKNRQVLAEAIQEITQKNLKFVRLMQSPAGIYERPEPGYLLTERNEFSLDELKDLFKKNGGDLSGLEEMLKESLKKEVENKISEGEHGRNINLKNEMEREDAVNAEEKRKGSLEASDPNLMAPHCEYKLSDKEAEEVWSLMSTDIASYVSQCQTTEQEIAQEFGGMSIGEAKKHAHLVCQSLINERFRCMADGKTRAADCICGSDI